MTACNVPARSPMRHKVGAVSPSWPLRALGASPLWLLDGHPGVEHGRDLWLTEPELVQNLYGMFPSPGA